MKKVAIYFSVILLFLFVGLSSVFAGYEEGLATYQRSDYETAFRNLNLLQNRKCTAQTSFGAMYASGRGVPRDYVMAYMWFNLAAAQGEETADALRTW